MTQLTQGSDMEEEKSLLAKLVDPTVMLDEQVNLLRRYKQRSIDRAVALTESDLAWCIVKLRGLGHPAEQLEAKYGLSPTTVEGERDGND